MIEIRIDCPINFALEIDQGGQYRDPDRGMRSPAPTARLKPRRRFLSGSSKRVNYREEMHEGLERAPLFSASAEAKMRESL
jgi:hypothetical protein